MKTIDNIGAKLAIEKKKIPSRASPSNQDAEIAQPFQTVRNDKASSERATEPRLKKCRTCGKCSDRMDKCKICKFQFQQNWFETLHAASFNYSAEHAPTRHSLTVMVYI
jgi:hypothetical protein